MTVNTGATAIPTPAPVLTATNVTKSYGERQVLRGVSLSINRGERVALTGASGSGKSTLLNCLGGVDRPDGGSIRFNGIALETLDADGLTEVRRRDIGTIFQFFHLLPTLTAAENVELPLQLNGVDRATRTARVCSLLARVGVADRAHALPSQLSGGEMQRVAIARALANTPSVLLADEPTGNLDSRNGAIILQLLQELSDETGTALLLVTHSAEAASICHREIHMLDGLIALPPRQD